MSSPTIFNSPLSYRLHSLSPPVSPASSPISNFLYSEDTTNYPANHYSNQSPLSHHYHHQQKQQQQHHKSASSSSLLDSPSTSKMYSPELPPICDLSDPSTPSEFKIGKMKSDVQDEDRNKKRQVRLMKNRQSAALSRSRKKEYITNLETKAQELKLVTLELHQKSGSLQRQHVVASTHLDEMEQKFKQVTIHNELLQKRIDEIVSITSPPTSSATTTPTLEKPSFSVQTTPHQTSRRFNDEIVIGMNKMNFVNNSKNNNNNNNNIDNNNNQHQFNPQPFLSISNPNVNSAPAYLTRARSSSYHPTPMDSSSNQQPNQSSFTPDSSPVLPSLHQLTKNINGSAPSRSSNLSSSPTRKNLLGYHHFHLNTANN